MPDLLYTNITKVVCMFNSVCANVVSPQNNIISVLCASYSQNRICCSLQLSLVYHITQWCVYKKMVS